jgi:hypothetical protein
MEQAPVWVGMVFYLATIWLTCGVIAALIVGVGKFLGFIRRRSK